jgi:hypothetical protein
MYELKKMGKVFTSKFVGAGPSSYKYRIYRAVVSQRLRNTAIHYTASHHQRQLSALTPSWKLRILISYNICLLCRRKYDKFTDTVNLLNWSDFSLCSHRNLYNSLWPEQVNWLAKNSGMFSCSWTGVQEIMCIICQCQCVVSEKHGPSSHSSTCTTAHANINSM